jgi:hypothetical protein
MPAILPALPTQALIDKTSTCIALVDTGFLGDRLSKVCGGKLGPF